MDNSSEEQKAASKALWDALGWFDESSFATREEKVYHYTTPEGLIGILKSDGIQLWFSKSDCLNDKVEGRFIYRLFHQKMFEMKEYGDITDEFYQKFNDGYSNDSDIFDFVTDIPRTIDINELSTRTLPPDPHYFICCFSKNQDSLPMWNYYTKGMNNRGYSIGLLTSELKSSIQKRSKFDMRLRNVIYDKDEQDKYIERLILQAYINCKILGERYTRDIFKFYLDEWRLNFKPECFAHEEEIRMIFSTRVTRTPNNDTSNTYEQKFRNNSGYVIPYFEHFIDKDALTSVTTGPLLDGESSQNGIAYLLHCRGYKGISLRTSKVPVRY